MAQDVRTSFHTLSQSEQLSVWLRLSLAKGIGPRHGLRLLEQLEFEQVYRANVAELSAAGCNITYAEAIASVRLSDIERCLDWMSQPSHFIVDYGNPNYPQLLRETYDPPLVLFGCGNPLLLNMPQIAVVGARTPTVYGLDITRKLAESLSSCGWTITSGLALGIDAAAHMGALQSSSQTIAVLGCGVDIVYPKRNSKLRSDILSNGGCLLSEFPPGTSPVAAHFPRRNRIVSGMSFGTVVTEAKLKSGSLITARLALEQNRDVFAMPGSIRSPMSEGCHFLISQGAKLVTTASDINEEYQHLNFEPPNKVGKNLQKNDCDHLDSVKLLDSVDSEVTALDVVVERSNLPISSVMAKLLQLELRGLVASVPGGYVKLRGK